MPQIVVIGRDVRSRAMTEQLLQEAGYSVADSSTGISGLATLYESSLPLVVVVEASAAGPLLAMAEDDSLLARHHYILLVREEGGDVEQPAAAEELWPGALPPALRLPDETPALLAAVEQALLRIHPPAPAAAPEIHP
jgi:CheY-like chemotaxis protein